MRAVEPVQAGFVERSGARVGYEVFGQADRPTVLIMPPWAVVPSRAWKMQVPYLARHYQVITWDAVGCGRSDRPQEAARYTAEEHAADALAVLETVGADRVVVLTASMGTHRSLRLAADHPEVVAGMLVNGPMTPMGPRAVPSVLAGFFSGDQRTFLEALWAAGFPEPHSTKAREDGIGWGLETSWSTLMLSHGVEVATDPQEFSRLAARVDCPVVIVQGDQDGVTPAGHATALLEAIGDNASLVLVEGGGHVQHGRDSVWFSLQVRALVDRVLPTPPARRSGWTRAMSRRRKALFLSSPVGLGHTRRDLAIAQQLRDLRPDLQVDWLTEHPVTQALEAAGERVHPASAWRSSESAHFESEAHGHDLHAFQAVRRMDEIQAANFMVLLDVLTQDRYDLVIADEAAETDYFLHENPELKSTAYAWLTDFVGWIPMASGGEHEAWLTSDYNAQMVEHVARFPRVRDRSVFIGSAGDLVDDPLGPGLPTVRAWTEEHFTFPGYVSGTPVYSEDERAELRSRFGYRDDQVTCIVTAGGTAVGATLLDRVLAAHPYALKQLPELRLIVVAGPRVDLRSLHPATGDVEVHGYLPDLDQHLAASDIAMVQGGLTTCMELTANRRPFLYFPLADHFEQQRHVAYRLDRYRAGRRLQLADVTAEDIAEALLAELNRPVDSRPVETGGARRAAEMLAELM